MQEGEDRISLIEKIERLMKEYFPFKDKSGNPLYRENQRETIINICKAFLIEGKKFVAVEGPVGCGKSVINYTVSRILGSTVYLTPLNMLQDQIVDEHWDEVKMLKGRRAYACNHCGHNDKDFDYSNIDFRCDYAGDKFDTCQTSNSDRRCDRKTQVILKKEIARVHKMFENKQDILTFRSAFVDMDEYDNLFENSGLKENLLNRKKAFLKTQGVDPEDVKYEYEIEKVVTCLMHPIKECPVRASRILARIAGVKILTPDIFFILSIIEKDYYGKSTLMVYDECQQIESVINRIFRVKIPLKTIKDFFNVDMLYLFELENMEEILEEINEFIHVYLGPLYMASKTIRRLGDLCSIRNLPTLLRCRSTNSLANIFYSCAKKYFDGDWKKELSVLKIVNYAFTGNELPRDLKVFGLFVHEVSTFFIKCCGEIKCVPSMDIFATIMIGCKRKYNGNSLNMLKYERTKKPTKGEQSDGMSMKDVIISEDAVYASHIKLFGNTVGSFITNIDALNRTKKKGDKNMAFIINKERTTRKVACEGTPLMKWVIGNKAYASEIESSFEVIPLNIGALMNRFFYSMADKVLLTSGTWVCPDDLFRMYGLPENNTKFIKIPSTFPPENRPIYVINNYTNFSEKVKPLNKEYLYKTDKGISKYLAELTYTLYNIRKYIKNKYNENANILVHCHTFDIIKNIARYAKGVNDSFLIHLPETGMSIENNNTGHVTWMIAKDLLIKRMKDNPNSGLTLISPSMSEGVDLKGKIARAQIILKKPTPYLGDKYVETYYKGNPDIGIPVDPNFINRICFTTMTQQYGRVMRAEDDWGITIIMDQSIALTLDNFLMKRSRRHIDVLNIGYFIEGIQHKLGADGMPNFTWPFG